MDMEQWAKSHCILLSEEDLQEDEREKLLTYWKNNPQKYFLFPSTIDFSKVMGDEFATLMPGEMGCSWGPSFAENVEFSPSAILHRSQDSVPVDDLAALLNEWIAAREREEAGENWLEVSGDEIAQRTRVQLGLLGIHFAVRTAEGAREHAWDQKLGNCAEEIRQEIPALRNLCGQVVRNELKGSFGKEMVQNFCKGLEAVENYCEMRSKKKSILFCGGKGHAHLAEFLERSGFRIVMDESEGANGQDIDICLVAVDGGESPPPSIQNLLQQLPKMSDHRRQLFVVDRPALCEQDVASVTRSQILAELRRELVDAGYGNNLLLFVDAVDALGETQDAEWRHATMTAENLLEEKGWKGKDEFLARSFLEKLFYPQPCLTGEELLQRMGIQQLLDYCLESRDSDVLGGLVASCNQAFTFLDERKWDGICSAQEESIDREDKKLAYDRMTLALAMERCKAATGEMACKAMLYEASQQVDCAVHQIQEKRSAICEDLWQELELDDQDMESLYEGQSSDTLTEFLQQVGQKIGEQCSILLREVKKNLQGLMNAGRERTKAAIFSLEEETKKIHPSEKWDGTLPRMDELQLRGPVLSDLLHNQVLADMARDSTEVFCTSEVGGKTRFRELAATAEFERYYMLGFFRHELRTALERELQGRLLVWNEDLHREAISTCKREYCSLRALCKKKMEDNKKCFRAAVESLLSQREAEKYDLEIIGRLRGQMDIFRHLWRKIAD